MFRNERTRVRPDLPRGKWTVVLRLAGIGDSPLQAAAGELLASLVPESQPDSPTHRRVILWDKIDGAIYARFEAEDSDGTQALIDSTWALMHGARILGLDTELEARIAPTSQVSPDRPLPETFPYMDDVTPEARDIYEAQQTAQIETDFSEVEKWLQ